MLSLLQVARSVIASVPPQPCPEHSALPKLVLARLEAVCLPSEPVAAHSRAAHHKCNKVKFLSRGGIHGTSPSEMVREGTSDRHDASVQENVLSIS